MQLLEGKPIVEINLNKVKAKLGQLDGYIPTLAIIAFGNEEDSVSYIRSIKKVMVNLGIKVRVFRFKGYIPMDDFEYQFNLINMNKNIDGIIVANPVSRKSYLNKIREIIDPHKDLDGLNPVNFMQSVLKTHKKYINIPCTAQAVMEILEYYNIELKGKKVVVINRSMTVGKPLAMMLLQKDATVVICHSRTENLKEECRTADIIITATGQPNFINADYISEGAIVIDVSINVDENGKLCGDTDFESVKDKVSAITPVPGGVGPVTTSIIAVHLFQTLDYMIRLIRMSNNEEN